MPRPCVSRQTWMVDETLPKRMVAQFRNSMSVSSPAGSRSAKVTKPRSSASRHRQAPGRLLMEAKRRQAVQKSDHLMRFKALASMARKAASMEPCFSTSFSRNCARASASGSAESHSGACHLSMKRTSAGLKVPSARVSRPTKRSRICRWPSGAGGLKPRRSNWLLKLDHFTVPAGKALPSSPPLKRSSTPQNSSVAQRFQWASSTAIEVSSSSKVTMPLPSRSSSLKAERRSPAKAVAPQSL
mmetsp:Transcript_109426/g.233877  ORF Transcript_109426/g.233877 Transcript_109426/m.233877 type:complete len:243 (+) Transcript_109426:936-1664(+)